MWDRHDYAIAEALYILDSEKCPKCGTPAWWAFSENAEIQFEVEETTCHACAHLEQHEEKHSNSKSKRHGITDTVKVVHADWEMGEETPLPSRNDWYAELKAKAEKAAAKKKSPQ